MCADLEAVLDGAKLSHLSNQLESLTFESAAAALSASRPAFLQHLRQLGCERLIERQAVANALGRAVRQGEGPSAVGEPSARAAAGPSAQAAARQPSAEATQLRGGGRTQPHLPLTQPRIWLTSDVHTDHADNMAWLRGLPPHGHDDVLVLAGDISHNMGVIEETLRHFVEKFGRVFYVPGNHEAWCGQDDEGDSFAKLERIRSDLSSTLP